MSGPLFSALPMGRSNWTLLSWADNDTWSLSLVPYQEESLILVISQQHPPKSAPFAFNEIWG